MGCLFVWSNALSTPIPLRIQINRRSKSLFSKLLFLLHAVSESCPFKEYGGGICPLVRLDHSQVSPTNDRFGPLHISSKVPLSIMMIRVDGRAKTSIIAGMDKSGPTLFHKDIYGYSAFNEIVDVRYSS